MAYSYADVEAAIARANGQKLATMKVGGLNGSTAADLGPSRNIKAAGSSPYVKGTGHVFAHVATYSQRLANQDMKDIAAAQQGKSLWQDRRTAIAAAHELINSPQAQPGLEACRAGNIPSSGTVWLKRIPLDGIYYGLQPGQNEIRLAETGSINFVVVGFSLFIYSCYPDGFVAGEKGLPEVANLASLFG